MQVEQLTRWSSVTVRLGGRLPEFGCSELRFIIAAIAALIAAESANLGGFLLRWRGGCVLRRHLQRRSVRLLFEL